jgi:hypothetical protein
VEDGENGSFGFETLFFPVTLPETAPPTKDVDFLVIILRTLRVNTEQLFSQCLLTQR